MNKLSLNTLDYSFTVVKGADFAGESKETNADFRKLLKDKQENGGEVSEDTDVKQTDTKGAEDVKDADTPQEDSGEGLGDKESLLAVYQLIRDIHPDAVKAEPGIGDKSDAAAETITVNSKTAVSEMIGQKGGIEASKVDAQVLVNPSDVSADTVDAARQTQIKDSAKDDAQPAEAMESVKTERTAFSESGEQAAAAKEGNEKAFTDVMAAEQTAVPTSDVSLKTGGPDAKTDITARVYVPEIEELPDKVAEQLLSKMADMVNEFEIHIEPEHLGKIAVKILYEAGRATVSVLCSEKSAVDILGRSAAELGSVIDRNLGGTTTIIVEKPGSDYLNQERDDGGNAQQEEQKGQQREEKKQSSDDAGQFLQKLRLGLLE